MTTEKLSERYRRGWGRDTFHDALVALEAELEQAQTERDEARKAGKEAEAAADQYWSKQLAARTAELQQAREVLEEVREWAQESVANSAKGSAVSQNVGPDTQGPAVGNTQATKPASDVSAEGNKVDWSKPVQMNSKIDGTGTWHDAKVVRVFPVSGACVDCEELKDTGWFTETASAVRNTPAPEPERVSMVVFLKKPYPSGELWAYGNNSGDVTGCASARVIFTIGSFADDGEEE